MFRNFSMRVTFSHKQQTSIQISKCVIVHVTVQHRAPPDIILAPENRTVTEGANVELVCRWTSGLPAYIMWLQHHYHNGSWFNGNFTELQV